MHLCVVLHKRTAGPAAGEAARRVFVEAMCEEATRDLLCWSMEKALRQGAAQAQQCACSHSCSARLGCMSPRFSISERG